MNKKIIYTGIITVLLAATAFVVLQKNGKLQNKVNSFYPLKERKGQMAQLPEWASVKEQGNKLIRIVRETPNDLKSTLQLATVYIQEGRATGNFDYYNEAALKYINDVLNAEPGNFEALILKSVVQLSQHRFAEALQTAGKAKAINPYNAYVYGLITDGNVEMGNYEEAIAALDKMVSIRPDLRSYSRISYLREIYGQTEAAIQAMKMAVDAGLPGDETTEWARVQLGHLYEKSGDIKTAEMHYHLALEERPGYAYALAGLAGIAIADNDYQKAIALYTQADGTLQDHVFKQPLANAYLLNGQVEKADEITDELIAILNEELKSGKEISNYHADKELVDFYLLKMDWDEAVHHAMKEYNRRPNNIEVAEMAAWTFYKKGEAKKALSFLQTALRTGSKNPTLLCRAAVIYDQVGEKIKAKTILQEVLKTNPNIDPLVKQESISVLNHL